MVGEVELVVNEEEEVEEEEEGEQEVGEDGEVEWWCERGERLRERGRG